MAGPIEIPLLTRKTPGIGAPAATRAYANPGSVCRSWVKRTRPSEAARSRITESAAADKPMSRTRSTLIAGCRRAKPLRMRPSKF